MAKKRGFYVYLALFRCGDRIVRAMLYERPEPLMFLELDDGFQLCRLAKCKRVRFHSRAVLLAISLAASQWRELGEFLNQRFAEMERSVAKPLDTARDTPRKSSPS